MAIKVMEAVEKDGGRFLTAVETPDNDHAMIVCTTRWRRLTKREILTEIIKFLKRQDTESLRDAKRACRDARRNPTRLQRRDHVFLTNTASTGLVGPNAHNFHVGRIGRTDATANDSTHSKNGINLEFQQISDVLLTLPKCTLTHIRNKVNESSRLWRLQVEYTIMQIDHALNRRRLDRFDYCTRACNAA
jgi:hypothetical protein